MVGDRKLMDNDNYSGSQNPNSDYSDSQNSPSPYSGKNAKRPATPAGPKLKVPVNGEVTILTSYPWNPPIDEKTEVEYLLNGKWHPSYPDYSEITGIQVNDTPGNFIALLGMITEYKNKSISRLNFFTHANKTVIGITGYMDSTNVYFTAHVDQTEIANYASSGLSFTYKKQDFTLDDVRARFTDDAIFVLYGCDAAFDPTTLLTALKDLLNVSVIGFKDKTVYCPSQTVGSTVFNRKGERIGVMKKDFKCADDSTTDWRSLIKNPNAVMVKK
jgi:hypothetical protein